MVCSIDIQLERNCVGRNYSKAKSKARDKSAGTMWVRQALRWRHTEAAALARRLREPVLALEGDFVLIDPEVLRKAVRFAHMQDPLDYINLGAMNAYKQFKPERRDQWITGGRDHLASGCLYGRNNSMEAWFVERANSTANFDTELRWAWGMKAWVTRPTVVQADPKHLKLSTGEYDSIVTTVVKKSTNCALVGVPYTSGVVQ